MTDKSELEKASLAWRQAELDKRGEDFRYKPRTVDAAFRDGALWLLEQAKEGCINMIVPCVRDTAKPSISIAKLEDLCGK